MFSFFNRAKQSQSASAPAPQIQVPITSGFTSGYSKSGVSVGIDEAMQLSDVLACVNVLAQSIASLPIELKEEQDTGGSDRAKGHPVYFLVNKSPNPESTAYDFKYWLMVDALLRGTGYAQVIRDQDGKPVELWPLLAAKVKPVRDKDGKLFFGYDSHVLPDEDVLRIQAMPHGGVIGKSIVSLQAATLGLAKAQEDSAAEFFANGIQSTLNITTPKDLSQPKQDFLRRCLSEYHKGKHRPLILEDGFTANPLSVNAEEAQLLESRKFSRSVIAGLFRVPAHLIGDLEKASFSNVESCDIQFIKHTLTPWAENWEARLAKTLLTKEEQLRMYFRFNFHALARGEIATRFAAYSQAINAGIMSPNEIRQMEDLPAYEGGDQRFIQGALRNVNDSYRADTAAANG